jgi:RNA polymerase sigma-70 factor, ECF subfamily
MGFSAATAMSEKPGPDLGTIYECEVAFVWDSLRRLGVREADLEDVTQEVFIAVQRRLPDFDATRPVRPWLFGFAYRMAADYRKSGRVRREVLDAAPEAVSRAPGAEEDLAAREARELVLAGLDRLSLEARAVLVLHDLDGYAMPDIAAVLGESVNTLYSRLRLARGRFTAAIRDAVSQRGDHAR